VTHGRRISVLGLLLAGVWAWGQPPVAWWENPVANGLTLTETQRDSINAIVREHQDSLRAARQAAEKAERELDAIYNADTVDLARGRAAIEDLVKARAELTRNLARMTLRLRAVLTVEQWRMLQSRGAVGRGRGPGRIPGGGRGRRGGPPPQSSENR
jgi:Spy/CpxP family protein refolding chaperone